MSRAQVAIVVGGVHASRKPAQISTLLGSCVAATLWDPVARVGGMNHFLLPGGEADSGSASRFGVHAMDLLIGEIQKLGGMRSRLRGKVFGAGAVLDMRLRGPSVSERNIRFIEEFFRDEEIPLLARDLGGRHARRVLFLTDTGQAFVKHLGQTALHHVKVEEQKAVAAPEPTYGEITLF